MNVIRHSGWRREAPETRNPSISSRWIAGSSPAMTICRKVLAFKWKQGLKKFWNKYEPDPFRKYLKELEKDGKFKIYDSHLERIFWNYLAEASKRQADELK